MPYRFHRLPEAGPLLALCAVAGLLTLSAAPARADHELENVFENEFASAFQHELGRIAARQVASVGDAIVSELLYPHLHGHNVCYLRHASHRTPVSFTIVRHEGPASIGHLGRYRRARHVDRTHRARARAKHSNSDGYPRRHEARRGHDDRRAVQLAGDVRPAHYGKRYMTRRENPELSNRDRQGRKHRQRDDSEQRNQRRARRHSDRQVR